MCTVGLVVGLVRPTYVWAQCVMVGTACLLCAATAAAATAAAVAGQGQSQGQGQGTWQLTATVCPMRWARSSAWRSSPGTQRSSPKTAVCAAVSVRPCPAARIESTKTTCGSAQSASGAELQGGTEAQTVQAVQAAQRCRRHSRGATRLRRRGTEVQGRRGADLHARRQRLKRLHASLPLGRRGRTVDAQAAHALGGGGLLHCVEHHLQSV